MITKEMYLLAKQIVANYEKEINVSDAVSRSYTYSDMETCFGKGAERGTAIGAAICGREMDESPQLFKEFINSDYN